MKQHESYRIAHIKWNLHVLGTSKNITVLEKINLNRSDPWQQCWTLFSSVQQDRPTLQYLRLIVFKTVQILDQHKACMFHF